MRKIVFAIYILYQSSFLYADAEPSFRITSLVGLSTFKSKLVESNDTSNTILYGFEVNAGANRNYNMGIEFESNSTKFMYANSTNTSLISRNYEIVYFDYRFSYLKFGVRFHRLDSKVKNQDVDYLDYVAFGKGFELGGFFPLSKDTQVFLEYKSDLAGSVKDAILGPTADLKIGTKSDLLIGSRFKITKSLLDVVIGYLQRNYSISVNGTSAKEVENITWLGLNYSFFN